MDKKGVELSLQFIIVAVLLLLILSISIYFLFGGAKKWTSGTQCSGKRGNCIGDTVKCDGGYIAPWSCDSGEKCCMKISN
jgi:hypothetical protein